MDNIIKDFVKRVRLVRDKMYRDGFMDPWKFQAINRICGKEGKGSNPKMEMQGVTARKKDQLRSCVEKVRR